MPRTIKACEFKMVCGLTDPYTVTSITMKYTLGSSDDGLGLSEFKQIGVTTSTANLNGLAVLFGQLLTQVKAAEGAV